MDSDTATGHVTGATLILKDLIKAFTGVGISAEPASLNVTLPNAASKQFSYVPD